MFKDILLPLDLSNAASQERTVSAAIELAKSFGSRLHVMTIVPTFGEGFVSSFFPADYQDNAMAAAKEQLHAFVREHIPKGIPVQHVVTCGTIYEEILTFARQHSIDLIVMASHRPELSDYLLGPSAARVTRHAACSVMVVRA
ncbi:MAG TPA: universal stress protein [Kiloniellaceae bacterium]